MRRAATSSPCETWSTPTARRIEAPNAFRYYRDALPSDQTTVNDRRKHFEGIFKTLRKAKIKRSELYLAWDFTVASNESNYRRGLHMRDEAFKVLGDTTMADQAIQGDAPDFTVTRPADQQPRLQRRPSGDRHLHRAVLPDQRLLLRRGHGPRRTKVCRSRSAPTKPTSSASSRRSALPDRAHRS